MEAEVIEIVVIAREEICFGCKRRCDIANAQWAFVDLRYRAVCDPNCMTFEQLVVYGKRFYDAQETCDKCTNKQRRVMECEAQ